MSILIDAPVNARSLIAALERAIALYGDLPILGGHIGDTTPPSRVTALNVRDEDVERSRDDKRPVAFFLEG